MSFDARSRERLEALGRSLPQRLPAPEPKSKAPDPAAPRHAVETERNPEQLFRELMGASRDGTVPPHLLDRLRELEKARAPRSGGAAPAPAPAPAAPAGGEPRRPQRNQRRQERLRTSTGTDAALYSEFQQLLLEDEP